MVKVPVGARVIIDLWAPNKKSGLIKYFENSLELVPATSDFYLEKGQEALVVDSQENLVKVVPIDEFTPFIFKNNEFRVNFEVLMADIYKMLKKNLETNGGIMSIDELYYHYIQTSIKDVLKRKHLERIAKAKKKPFDVLKHEGMVYFAIKPAENPHDMELILKLAKNKKYLTIQMIQAETGWIILRIERILEYAVEKDYCEKDTEFRTGTRYYFRS
ncbi:MAG: hypothetical protein ACTSWN_04330 [Promethearchaeota archaeon]